MSGEQLERSILERKERDELHAIAQAMSIKPAARWRKADIIDQILQATGIDPAQEGAAPATASRPGGSRAASSTRARANGISSPPLLTVVPAVDVATAPSGAVAEVADDHSALSDASEKAAPAGLGAAAVPTSPRSRRSAAERRAATDAAGVEQVAMLTDLAVAPDAAVAPEAVGSPEAAGADAPTSPGATPVAAPVSAAPSASASTTSHPARALDQGQHGAASDLGNRRGRRRRGRDARERDPERGADASFQGELVTVRGLLDLRDEGFGFLRTTGYLPSQKDVYVSVSQARRLGLRRGDAIEGGCRPAGPSEKYPALMRVDTVAGMPAEEAKLRRRFEDLTPLFPDEQLRLEMPGDSANLTARIVDLVAPIGKGQRGMIVSPPKAGKTTIMKQIAHSIEANNPNVHLMVLLVGERPEEVTDIRRSVKGEVIASTFDRPSEEHTIVAELAVERAKRLVELGQDVVIILDGITRLARAYNLAQPATGRVMSGGVDSGALYPPKKIFGAARNVEEGGSLTILATALVETGSKMDEVIFEEFKGTGNLELRLDRRLAERRLYPAIDVNGSSTRHEELLFDRHQLQQVWKLRRVLNALSNEGSGAAGLELLMDKIKTTRSNDEFLAEIAKAPTPTT